MGVDDDNFEPGVDPGGLPGGNGPADTGPDEFDAAISEFEQAEPDPKSEAKSAAEWRERAKEQGLLDGEIEALLPEDLARDEQRLEAARGDLIERAQFERSMLQEAIQLLHEDREQLRLERDRSDFREFKRTLSRDIPGFEGLSGDLQDALLLGLHAKDAKVARDWANRYEGRGGANTWAFRAGEIAGAVHELMRRQYDSDLTSDRMAVADAVRSRGGTPPARPAPSYGNMTDDEFNHELSELGIESR